MDFQDTTTEAEFRADIQTWLAENAPKFAADKSVKRDKEDDSADLARAKAWQAAKAEAGYACLTWPEEYGGSGLPPIFNVVWEQEESKYDVPRGFFSIGIGMAGPTMMKYAQKEANDRLLPKMRSGHEVWCQLFSEPSAGSDLAGLKTRAERDGDDWIINGQKVWTSGAHYSDYGILVTRHDTTVPKHMGLTYFYIDMKAPGVEIVRIKQISGASNFCEVFFNDLRIPDSQRLGEVGDGWSVALTTLMNERLAVGDAPPPDFDQLFEMAQTATLDGKPAIQNPAIRQKLAEWYIEARGLKYTKFRTMTALSKGQTPGPEASIGKLVGATKLQDISSFAMDLQAMGGVMVGADDTPQEGLFQNGYLSAPGLRIAGGTDEILRNIIAERVLGLPPDIRVDKKVAFNELTSGAAT